MVFFRLSRRVRCTTDWFLFLSCFDVTTCNVTFFVLSKNEATAPVSSEDCSVFETLCHDLSPTQTLFLEQLLLPKDWMPSRRGITLISCLGFPLPLKHRPTQSALPCFGCIIFPFYPFQPLSLPWTVYGMRRGQRTTGVAEGFRSTHSTNPKPLNKWAGSMVITVSLSGLCLVMFKSRHALIPKGGGLNVSYVKV